MRTSGRHPLRGMPVAVWAARKVRTVAMVAAAAPMRPSVGPRWRSAEPAETVRFPPGLWPAWCPGRRWRSAEPAVPEELTVPTWRSRFAYAAGPVRCLCHRQSVRRGHRWSRHRSIRTADCSDPRASPPRRPGTRGQKGAPPPTRWGPWRHVRWPATAPPARSAWTGRGRAPNGTPPSCRPAIPSDSRCRPPRAPIRPSSAWNRTRAPRWRRMPARTPPTTSRSSRRIRPHR